MRGRFLIVAAAMTAVSVTAGGASAAPVAVIAGGPMRPPGGFSQTGMHPVFTSCSLADFSTLTSTTITTFIIRPNTNEAYFQITNRCGTYDETFKLGECSQSPPGEWYCDHLRPDGFRAVASYSIFQGQPHIFATEVKDSDHYWTVSGFLLAGAITTI